MRRLLSLLVLLLPAMAQAQAPAPPGRFDYYVLALSWSPSYCASNAGRDDAEQCAMARPNGFVVHGLWPQHKRGGWPAACAAPSAVPGPVMDSMLPLMPARKLIQHQWDKHGTCDGGEAEDYFARTRDARAQVRVPVFLDRPAAPVTLPVAEIERLFAAVNPGLTPDGIAVICRGTMVEEVRLCLDRDLGFRRCGGGVADRCKGKATFPPAR
ncbi:ribonuclease T2 [Magnetospirillum sp. UT-4]|uniref:ribonuclease T2 family protein n=1 Tax=Magnetospirillum sp. UT-4 TaxID=2681467 RepID=UPI0013802E2E|nr:ribonuclease T2 [Magnetospirillum sp. UT-4]CAA7620293.1 putative ribonuclease T2 [Magnetospirillum sp. UT-4]